MIERAKENKETIRVELKEEYIDLHEKRVGGTQIYNIHIYK